MKLAAIPLRQFFFLNQGEASKLAPTPGALISNLLPNVLIVAGVIFFLLILGGGFGIISSAGSGDSKSAAKGKAAITYGVIGFLIVVASYFILQIVSYSLTGSDILINTPLNLN